VIGAAANAKKKRCSVEFYARASWGAAMLRPYTDFGAGCAVVADQAATGDD
jgi:hypothetical protein